MQTKVSEVEGVETEKSPFVIYGGDNCLTELFREEWQGGVFKGEPIEHLYTVSAPTGGTHNEFHFHEHTADRYMILSGEVDVGLYDGREGSPTFGAFLVVSLSTMPSQKPNLLRIPPGVWHSLRWRSSEGLLLNAKTPSYSRGLPDKFRVQPEDYPDAINWNVE